MAGEGRDDTSPPTLKFDTGAGVWRINVPFKCNIRAYVLYNNHDFGHFRLSSPQLGQLWRVLKALKLFCSDLYSGRPVAPDLTTRYGSLHLR